MKMKKWLPILLLSPLTSLAQNAPAPYGVLPTERQLHWQEMEMYALVHFTPTTFQDKEWGYGDASPSLFNPTHFDANQVAKAAADAGLKGLIIVAKHHDGFCLWPTKVTDYNISKSSWLNGKGDVVGAFQKAAAKNKLKFGTYLSAWDRNDLRYGSSAYTEAYRAELTELMTNYGPLFISWHDGANGGDGYYGGKNEKRLVDRSIYYEWDTKTWLIVRKLQPNAVIFSDVGWDVRWVGNERGMADNPSWETITLRGIDGKKPAPGYVKDDLHATGTRNGEQWIPAECDVPLRPGWFYHASQDGKSKSPDQLFKLYLNSVGRSACLDLGLSPTTEGILSEEDVYSLKVFGEKLKKTFAINLADGATIKASNTRGNVATFAPNNILDKDRYSYYASEDQEHSPTLEITLKKPTTFDLIRLRENIKLGQRMDSVQIDYWENGKWKQFYSVQSIGANRLIKLEKQITTTKIKLHLFAPVAPTLSDFGLFLESHLPYAPKLSKEPSPYLATTNFKIVKPIKGAAITDQNNETFAMVSTEEGVVIELDAPTKGLYYLPRQDGKKDGIIQKFIVYTSEDSSNWSEVMSGEFSNIVANPIAQTIRFPQTIHSKFIKFVPKDFKEAQFSVAEIRLLK